MRGDALLWRLEGVYARRRARMLHPTEVLDGLRLLHRAERDGLESLSAEHLARLEALVVHLYGEVS